MTSLSKAQEGGEEGEKEREGGEAGGEGGMGKDVPAAAVAPAGVETTSVM
jgi:hypothetical protein